MEIKIDQDVPIPTVGARAGTMMDTIRGMKVGESFLLPSSTKRNSICNMARLVGVKVITRSVEGGFRVWRIA